MVIRDALRGRVLWHKYVTHETVADYMEGIDWLKSNGFRIYGAVIDGIKGLAKALAPIPVQLCQFHQMLTVRHYLTREPELEASRELLKLVNGITRMDKASFTGALGEWYRKYQESSTSGYTTGASRRTNRRSCARGYAAHTSASSGTCLFCGHSMTGQRPGCRIRTTHLKDFSQT